MIGSYEEAIIRKWIRFGEGNDAIGAILLTSSLCNPNAPRDILSDFDVEVYFHDPKPFVENDDWLETLGCGPLMALWHWPNEWDHEKGDDRSWTRAAYFQDGTKMDITLGYLDDLRKLSNENTLSDHYDIGYKVLLDKDGVTACMKPPTHKAYIVTPPTKPQFASRVETFWADSTHASKSLWRDEIIFANWMLQGIFDCCLREMLEWSVAMKHDWNWRPGKHGRGLLKALGADTRKALIECFPTANLDSLWTSLFCTTALYRKTAVELAETLGFNYPHDLDRRVTIYHETLRGLDRKNASRESLAKELSERYKMDSL